jgi:FkbM family methyltransferase
VDLIKTLNLLGHQVTFTSSDDDYYLETIMRSEGPVDIEKLFSVFCREGCTVVDVGANIGVTAVIAGLLVSTGCVLALEPVPGTFEYLARNVTDSNLTNVKCFNKAAAAAEGHVRLVTRPGYSFAAFVGYDEVLARYTEYDEERVESITLDQLVANEELSRVDFIKIDVEGFELEVLRGSTRILERFQPAVLLEANHYCLNIFRRISMVDFTEEILSHFPIVIAVDATLATLDLTLPGNHPEFFHENVVLGRYQNLVCGFDPAITEQMERLRSRGRIPDVLVNDAAVDTVSRPDIVEPSSTWRRRATGLLNRLSARIERSS